MGSQCSLLSRVMATSAMPIGARLSLPAKMTSSVLRARSVRLACSPSTQRMESATFVLPQPLGPTIQVTPGPNCNCVRLAKLLKPWTSRRLRYNQRLSLVGLMLAIAAGVSVARALNRLERVLRGLLLGRLLAAAFANSERATADHHLHGEAPRVVGALGAQQPVRRRRLPARLDDLLQARLRVVRHAAGAQRLEVLAQRPQDEGAHLAEAAIEEDRADDRLVRPGEVVWAATAAGGVFAAAEVEIRADVQPLGGARERVAPDEVGAELRELALVDVGVFGVELVRDDDAEGGIAEEFEALVRADVDAGVLVEVGRVDQGLPEQLRVFELHAEPRLERSPVGQAVTSDDAGQDTRGAVCKHSGRPQRPPCIECRGRGRDPTGARPPEGARAVRAPPAPEGCGHRGSFPARVRH